MKRIRAVFCGNTMVGKSSIIKRFSDNVFDANFKSTVGGSYIKKSIKINKETISLEVWDTAGSERFNSIIPSFFRNANVVAIIYDITDIESFNNLNFWIKFVADNAPQNVPIFIVGNKADLNEKRTVSFEEGHKFSVDNKADGFFETSAKTGEQIIGLFNNLASVQSCFQENDVPSSKSAKRNNGSSCCK